ncbi:MAG: hypothetical protein IMY75_12270, partial [Chloroflexi bacterium]|nr:hypothetical protein [Chloroflexota bacterium]
MSVIGLSLPWTSPTCATLCTWSGSNSTSLSRPPLSPPQPGGGRRVRVIGVVPDQVVTEHLVEPVKVVDGLAVADPARDLLKMAVIERHRGTGNVGLGFVRGLGLKRGAIAGSVG